MPGFPRSTALLEDAGLDAVLATKDASIAYFTGFWGLQLERFFGVAVRRGGGGALIAPTLDRDSVSGRADRPGARRSTTRRSPTGCPELFATLDGAKRDRRRGGPPELRALPRAGRGRLRARARHRRRHAPARRQGRRGGRGRPARLRAHRGRLRGAVGGPAAGRRSRPRSTPASRSASPAAARRPPSRTSCSAPTRPRGTASPTSATLAAGRRHRRRHRGAVRRLLGRPHALRARRAAERLGRPRPGRSCTRPTSAAVAATRVGTTCRDVDAAQRAIIEAHPDDRRLPARRRPRDRHRDPRAAVPDRELGRSAARGHDLHRRARDLRLRARRDPARGRRAGRPRRAGHACSSHARSSYGFSSAARLRAYIRRIFSRLPQVAIEHQRRRPLVSRNTQPQSRPGAAVQARHPRRVGEQRDGVGGDREAHAARLVVAPSRGRSRRPRAASACRRRPPARRRTAAARARTRRAPARARARRR